MKKTFPMAMVTAPGKVEFREKVLDQLYDHDVLIRVKAAAICGSDLHIFKGKHPSAPLPCAVGHELAGRVERVGRHVSRLKEGDRVVVEPIIVCGQCEFCLSGRYNLCSDISFQYRRGQGGFASYFICNENWVYPLPANVTYKEGALVEPLSVAVHAVNKAGIRFGKTVTIFGDGAIGLLVLMLVNNLGPGDTFLAGAQASRLALATALGATHVLDNMQGDAVANILTKTSGLGTDFSFEAVGLQKTLQQSLDVLKKGGTAVVVGIFEKPEITLAPNLFIQKEISLVGSQGYCRDFQTALRLMEKRRVQPGKLISHVLPLDSLQEGFELLMDQKTEATKVVIEMD
jgi:2-desacetyl-2-hydroxyethyl bacteriochlorophyllide A dehydrogenase